MIDAWHKYLEPFGMDTKARYSALRRLAERPGTIGQIVESSGTSRRSVEQLIRSFQAHVQVNSRKEYSLPIGTVRDEVIDILHEFDQHIASIEQRAADPQTIQSIRRYVANVPHPKRDLDHVQATPDTILRRAVWLASEFSLQGKHITFIGDHDLTSLALRLVEPKCALSVVDVDEELLDYIAQSRSVLEGAAFHLRYADLRESFPTDLLKGSDAFVTDPPYTADGVQLFAARGIQALRNPGSGRGMIAYGYGEQMQTLGLKVQKAIIGLDMVFEEVIKSFNVYAGAHAIGSRSDWYVLRATPSSMKRSSGVIRRSERGIYTHGVAAVESSLDPIQTEALARKFSEAGKGRKTEYSDQVDSDETDPKVVDLRGYPDSAAFRHMLNRDISSLVLLVDNHHPSLQSRVAQESAASAIAPKYSLKFYRSFPTSKSAVIHATATPVQSSDSRALFLSKSGETVSDRLRACLSTTSSQPETTKAWQVARDEKILRARVRDCPITTLRMVKKWLPESES